MKEIRVKVLYFAQAREAAGTGSELVTMPNPSSVKALVARSMANHKQLGRVTSSMQVAVNEELAGVDRVLADGDVVAFLPPVAGG